MDRVEFKPIPVKRLLSRMKDLSELMIDLAYSAVLFDDMDLANEVVELGEEVDKLCYLMRMTAALAARDKEDAEEMAGLLSVASAIDKISDAAVDIANIKIRGIGVPSFVWKAFTEAEERVCRAKIRENSILADKTIGQLKLESEAGVDIIAIRRKGRLIIHPSIDEKIQVEDVVVARGADESLKLFSEIASGELRRIP